MPLLLACLVVCGHMSDTPLTCSSNGLGNCIVCGRRYDGSGEFVKAVVEVVPDNS